MILAEADFQNWFRNTEWSIIKWLSAFHRAEEPWHCRQLITSLARYRQGKLECTLFFSFFNWLVRQFSCWFSHNLSIHTFSNTGGVSMPLMFCNYAIVMFSKIPNMWDTLCHIIWKKETIGWVDDCSATIGNLQATHALVFTFHTSLLKFGSYKL